jgi:hypothetical protein
MKFRAVANLSRRPHGLTLHAVILAHMGASL